MVARVPWREGPLEWQLVKREQKITPARARDCGGAAFRQIKSPPTGLTPLVLQGRVKFPVRLSD